MSEISVIIPNWITILIASASLALALLPVLAGFIGYLGYNNIRKTIDRTVEEKIEERLKKLAEKVSALENKKKTVGTNLSQEGSY